jgi:DNA-binding response OmpR family regulator
MVKHILLVEDEADLRNNLSELLEIKNYKVTKTANGQQALDLLEKSDVDLIVADILMPIMDGYELLQKVRGNINYANLPIIFLSAKVSKDEIREGMLGGAEDYLTKPIKGAELLKAVETSLSKKEKREAWANKELGAVLNKERNVRFHELRTPLFGVMSILELLHQDLRPEQTPMAREIQAGWVEKALEAVKRLNNSLLKLTLFQELGSIANVSKKKLRLFEVLRILQESGKKLPKFVLQGEDCHFDFEPLLWDFVINELLENAEKFGDAGKPVTITGKNNKFSVRNEQQQFDRPQIVSIRPFYQFNRDYQEQQGLGIGLFLAKKYCKINGANLEARVDSNLNFVVSITFETPS